MPRLAVVATPLLVWSLWLRPLGESAQDAAATPRLTSPSSTALRSSSVTDGRSPRRRRCRCLPAIAFARRTAASKSCSTTAARCISTRIRSWTFSPTKSVRLLDGRVRLNIVGAGAAESALSPTASTRHRHGCRSRAPANTGSRSSAAAKDAAIDVELAVLRGGADLVNEDGRTMLGAGERAFARAGAGPSPSYVFNSASWDDFDRWSEARRDQPPRRVRRVPARERANLRVDVQPVRVLAERADLRLRLVSRACSQAGGRTTTDAGRRFARGAGRGSDRIPGRGRRITTDAGASRPGSWFWIPGRTWGPAWVSWAYAPGLRELVPARVEQPRGLRIQRRRLRRPSIQRVERVDCRSASRLRPRLRQRERRQLTRASTCARATRSSFATPRRTIGDTPCRAPERADSLGRGRAARRAQRRFLPRIAQRAGRRLLVEHRDWRRRRRLPQPPFIFRSLDGSGYPAPAREPRDISSLPAPTRQAVPRSRDANATAPPSTRSTSSPQDIRTAETPDTRSIQRAARRSSSVFAPIDQAERRRCRHVASRIPARPTRPRRTLQPAEAYRAVPRTDRPARESDFAAHQRRLSAARLSAPTAAPSQDAPERMPRAMPRSAPDNSGLRGPGGGGIARRKATDRGLAPSEARRRRLARHRSRRRRRGRRVHAAVNRVPEAAVTPARAAAVAAAAVRRRPAVRDEPFTAGRDDAIDAVRLSVPASQR